MRDFRVILGLATFCILGGGMCRAQGGGTPTFLEQFSAESEKLYKATSASMARLTVTQSAAAVLDDRLKAEFAEWLAQRQENGPPPRVNQGGSGRGRGPGRDGPRDGGGPGGPQGGSFGGGGRGGPGPGGAMSGLVQSFLQDRLDKAANQEEKAQLAALLERARLYRGGFQGDNTLLIMDGGGHAILLAGLMREAHRDGLKVQLPDGTEASAKFVGANLAGGFTVVQLDKFTGLKPIKWAEHHPSPGQAIMSVTAGQGLVAWVAAVDRSGMNPDDRFQVPAPDDRSGAFLFDVHGQLVGVVGGGGPWSGDRIATSASRLKKEFDYIVSTGKDLERPRLGFVTDALPETMTAELVATLHNRHAVLVSNVNAGSLAERAGLKKGDVLVSIDNRSIAELSQVQMDLAFQVGTVPLGVVRNVNGTPQEMTLQLPLK